MFISFNVTLHPDYGVAYSKFNEDNTKLSISFNLFQKIDNIIAKLKVFVATADGRIRHKFLDRNLNWCKIAESSYSDFFASLLKEYMHPCPIKVVNNL